MCYKELKEANITPILHRLNNEISSNLIDAIKEKNLKYQTVTVYDHRQNLAERAIQTYKSFLISNLHGTDHDFPEHLWCQLLEQVELQVNLIRPSRINPNRSAWEELHGTFDFNATPLAPLGTKGVIYIHPEARDTSYSDHGKEGWYIGPVFTKYRNYAIYIPATNGTRESNCVEFFPTKVEIPNSNPNDRISAALENLSYELKQIRNNENDTSLIGYGTPVNRAIKSLKLNIDTQLEEALEKLRDSPTKKLANNEPRRVIDDANSPRVPNNFSEEQDSTRATRVPAKNAPAARVPVTISDARGRFKVGTEISKKFDGISYKGKVIKPYNGRHYLIEYEDGDE